MKSSVSSETTIESVTVPLRIFLCDVVKYAKQNKSNSLFRLMGTIVEILPQQLTGGRASSSYQKCSTKNSVIGFVIDDGSGTVAVFTRRKLRSDSCSSTTEASNQQSVPQPLMQQGREIDQQYNNFTSSSSTITSNSILSSPLPALKVGQTVDCIGRFVVDSGDKSPDDPNLKFSEEEHQSSHQIIWLAASALSIVTSPQEASLRQIELCSPSNENNLTIETNSTLRGKHFNDHMPKNRILIAGNLNLKLNSLVYNNNNQQQQQQPVFKPDDAFRYIRYSKDDGGISGPDLALLVGATKAKEKMAVKASVEHLQNLGMVYMKQGKYYPL
jgi:hypothetical protein